MRYWTEDEIKYVRENVTTMTDKDIGIALNRGRQSVKWQRVKMGLSKEMGGSIHSGKPRKMLGERFVIEKPSKYFNVREVPCWITGVKP